MVQTISTVNASSTKVKKSRHLFHLLEKDDSVGLRFNSNVEYMKVKAVVNSGSLDTTAFVLLYERVPDVFVSYLARKIPICSFRNFE